MPDHVEDLALLREQSDVLLQQTRSAEQAVGPVEGSDGTGEVVVHLDAEGRFRTVRIGIAWDRSLSGAELPAAVLEAFAAARVARLEAYAAAVTEAADAPPPRPRPARDGAGFVDAFRDRLAAEGQDPEAAGALVAQLLEDVREGLDEANRLLDDHATARHQGRSGSGHARATVSSGGELLEVWLDQRWLLRAHPANLGREITDAVLDALKRSRREGVAALLQAGRLARVARMAMPETPARPDPAPSGGAP